MVNLRMAQENYALKTYGEVHVESSINWILQ